MIEERPYRSERSELSQLVELIGQRPYFAKRSVLGWVLREKVIDASFEEVKRFLTTVPAEDRDIPLPAMKGLSK